MKKTFLILLSAVAFWSCCSKQNELITKTVERADIQVTKQIELIESNGMLKDGRWLNPRTLDKKGNIEYVPIIDWTSGFFPGTVWYMYDLTKDQKYLAYAQKYTQMLDSLQDFSEHHDVGFMVECSFGNGYKLTQNETYRNIMVNAANALCRRYIPEAKTILSWDIKGWQALRGWQCPVIIDNMMNLELLFNATNFTGDSTYYNIAVNHANTTKANHFREDNSCYHVVDYDPKSGEVRYKHTAQGEAHESAWARGQAWAIYGFTVCYRYTKNVEYLEQAKNTFNFYWNDSNMPEDKVPYWDYNAIRHPELRDASAAAIVASALYEMSTYDLPEYKAYADKIVESLASPAYLAEPGTNGNFLLMHCVGSIPHGQEIDVPLNYADYYFLEALVRKRNLENK